VVNCIATWRILYKLRVRAATTKTSLCRVLRHL